MKLKLSVCSTLVKLITTVIEEIKKHEDENCLNTGQNNKINIDVLILAKCFNLDWINVGVYTFAGKVKFSYQ